MFNMLIRHSVERSMQPRSAVNLLLIITASCLNNGYGFILK